MSPSSTSLPHHRRTDPVRRRGYLRSRPEPMVGTSFVLEGHRFETSERDLWVTPAGDARFDRIKVTRSSTSRSAQRGYPGELIWPQGQIQRTQDELVGTARTWLDWRSTEEGRTYPLVRLDQWRRQAEQEAA